jgi:chromate transporter
VTEFVGYLSAYRHGGARARHGAARRVLNLAIWFALHVFFARITLVKVGPLQLWTPSLSTLDWRVVVLSALSAVLLLKQHWSIPWVLAVASTLALVIRFAGI